VGDNPHIHGFSFEDFFVDTVRGCLFWNEEERILRHQTFRVLLYLVEHPDVPVTKDQLADAIWENASVTDNTLVQCITEIRKALGDDPRHPHFIRTLPKVGYRFLPAVTPCYDTRECEVPAAVVPGDSFPQEDRDSGGEASRLAAVPAGDLPAHSTPSSSGDNAQIQPPGHLADRVLPYASPVGPFSRFPSAAVFTALCGVALGLVSSALLLHHRLPHFYKSEPVRASEQLSVAIFPFKNQTQRPDLDWLSQGLPDMLSANLRHSQRLQILANDSLPALPQPDGTSTAPELQAARTAHASVIVIGTVTQSGDQLQLNASLEDARDGHILATEDEKVLEPGEIVLQARALSERLAGHLGVPPSTEPSPSDVMTTSADAYRYYIVGVERAQAFQNAQAIDLLRKAISADPNFAMAYARIGYAYAVSDFLPQQAIPYLQKASELSKNLPDKDRMYIAAWYAIARADYQGAAKDFAELIERYPDESEPYYQLSRLLHGQEQDERAITILQQGLKRIPNSANLYNSLGMSLLSLHRYAEAIRAHIRYEELAPQDPNSHDSLGMTYQQSGDYYAALTEYGHALAIDPEFEPSIVHVGDAYFQEGRYLDAIEAYSRYVQVTHSQAAKALGYGDLATVYRAMGNRTLEQQAAANETRENPHAVWDSLLLAWDRSDKSSVARLERILQAGVPNHERGYESDLRTRFYYQGYLAMKSGDRQGAIASFTEALKHLPPSSGIDSREDCLADAYHEFGMLPEAAAEYERILKQNPNYPLAAFHLGEVYRQMGDVGRSQTAFANFLTSWRSADPDIAAVLQARQQLESGGTSAQAAVPAHPQRKS
jgi:tetratricopeptide (TPR) repeat protein/DNA-binding winged helix-turn-helix (wHTH) protein